MDRAGIPPTAAAVAAGRNAQLSPPVTCHAAGTMFVQRLGLAADAVLGYGCGGGWELVVMSDLLQKLTSRVRHNQLQARRLGGDRLLGCCITMSSPLDPHRQVSCHHSRLTWQV